jgi:hypothetical protein
MGEIKQRRHRHPDGSLVETAELPDGRVIRVIDADTTRMIGASNATRTVNSREMFAWLDWLKRRSGT